MVWREEGPNEEPIWKDVSQEWSANGQLWLRHGDVVVVQEHPDELPAGLVYPQTGPEWMKARR